MKEYIEEIIEIILENVSCEHQIEEEYSGGPAFDNVAYSLNDEKSVIEKCLKVIMMNKPVVTEEFIEKKAREMHQENYGSIIKCDYKCNAMERFRKLIRSLFEIKKEVIKNENKSID